MPAAGDVLVVGGDDIPVRLDLEIAVREVVRQLIAQRGPQQRQLPGVHDVLRHVGIEVVGVLALLLGQHELVELSLDVLADLLGHLGELAQPGPFETLRPLLDGVKAQAPQPAHGGDDDRSQDDQTSIHG